MKISLSVIKISLINDILQQDCFNQELILLQRKATRNVQYVTDGILIMGLNFKNLVFNGCHDLLMMSPDISSFTIITVIDYCFIIYGISKSDAIHQLENYLLDDLGFI